MPHKHLVYAAFNFSYAYCFMGEIAFSVRYFSLPVCLKYSSADFINNLKTRPVGTLFMPRNMIRCD